MNTNLTAIQRQRLNEMSDACDDVMQVLGQMYVEEGHKNDLEQALGHLYAIAGRMALEQDISWTGLCECANHHYDEEKTHDESVSVSTEQAR